MLDAYLRLSNLSNAVRMSEEFQLQLLVGPPIRTTITGLLEACISPSNKLRFSSQLRCNVGEVNGKERLSLEKESDTDLYNLQHLLSNIMK